MTLTTVIGFLIAVFAVVFGFIAENDQGQHEIEQKPALILIGVGAGIIVVSRCLDYYICKPTAWIDNSGYLRSDDLA